MLYQALFVPPDTIPLAKEAIFQPELAKYVANWGLDDDRGLIAVLEESQTLMGAVWLRLFNSSNPGYGYIDDDTPELSIAILPEYRGQGIGTTLLATLFSHLRNQYSAISLSVSPQNPALHLYRRFGFEVTRRHHNSLVMQKNL